MELRVKAKSGYLDHNEAVREACRKEGGPMLEYKLGSGLQPSCDFLDMDVPPDTEFPITNPTHSTVSILESAMNMVIQGAAVKAVTWLVMGFAFGAVSWVWWRILECSMTGRSVWLYGETGELTQPRYKLLLHTSTICDATIRARPSKMLKFTSLSMASLVLLSTSSVLLPLECDLSA